MHISISYLHLNYGYETAPINNNICIYIIFMLYTNTYITYKIILCICKFASHNYTPIMDLEKYYKPNNNLYLYFHFTLLVVSHATCIYCIHLYT